MNQSAGSFARLTVGKEPWYGRGYSVKRLGRRTESRSQFLDTAGLDIGQEFADRVANVRQSPSGELLATAIEKCNSTSIVDQKDRRIDGV